MKVTKDMVCEIAVASQRYHAHIYDKNGEMLTFGPLFFMSRNPYRWSVAYSNEFDFGLTDIKKVDRQTLSIFLNR